MTKNKIIIILGTVSTVSLIFNMLTLFSNNDVDGHPRPIGETVYDVRDPNSSQIKMLIYATEWTDKRWGLTVLFKTDNNEVIRFWTISPNDPRQWMADKLCSSDSLESKPMSIEKMDYISPYKIGPRIWAVSEVNEPEPDIDIVGN